MITEVTLPIIYVNLAELSDTLMRRMHYKLVTLELTQSDYDDFITDLDAVNMFVNKFRPIKVETVDDQDTEICEWVFSGSLKIKFKIKC